MYKTRLHSWSSNLRQGIFLVHNVKLVHNIEIKLITKIVSTGVNSSKVVVFYIIIANRLREIIFLDQDQNAESKIIRRFRILQYSIQNV